MTDSPSFEADLSAVEPADPPSTKAIVDLANHLLKEFNISTKVEDVNDITPSLFVVLYESLFSDKLPGIIRQPVSKEDEVHNCQIVIDVLSTDVVKDSLSHIKGVDIVAGDKTAILNLLDIFSYLLEYVAKRIEKEADINGTGSFCASESEQSSPAKPAVAGRDRDSPQKLRGLPMSKLGSTAASNTTNNNGTHLPTTGRSKVYANRNENRKTFGSRDVITHEDFYAMSYGGISLKDEPTRAPSPIRPDTSQSLLGQRTIDSDFDTDIEKPENKAYNPLSNQPRVAWESSSSKAAGPTETVIDGVTLRACTKLVREAPWESTAYNFERPIPSFSASMPAPRMHTEPSRGDPLRATVGPIPYTTYTTPREHKTQSGQAVKGLSSSYNDLRELVERNRRP
ncbi:hypothetical protein EGW08_017000 [Elysia chlorotica]|uniref:DUF5745 domain-containing protein n=1 Tax=Elysia chlorotica TaxID=188477 RepID=A0A433T110_ELYCH|nr:hypothetical protein EGW08_017000 [Elysia chlorotica]